MLPTFQATLQDHHAEPAARSAGRFASQIDTAGWPDPELAPVRSATVLRMQARVQYRDYQIDAAAVADAITERLSAGGLTTRR